MKKLEEIVSIAETGDSYFSKAKCFLEKEFLFLKERYCKFGIIGKTLLISQIVIFVVGIFGTINWLFGLLNDVKFYLKSPSYVARCNNEITFSIDNEEICDKYKDSFLGFLMKKSDDIDLVNEPDYLNKYLLSNLGIKDVLYGIRGIDDGNIFKIKEQIDGFMSITPNLFFLNSYKKTDSGATIDGYLNLHTIGQNLESKNVIYSVSVDCTGSFYAFHASKLEYVPFSCDISNKQIETKLIYCDDGKVVKNIFDNCVN